LLVSFWPLYILKSHKKLVSIIYKDNFLRNKKNKIHQDWEKNRCSTYNKRQHPSDTFGPLVSFMYFHSTKTFFRGSVDNHHLYKQTIYLKYTLKMNWKDS
jgi:hypothetical protein